MSGDPVRTERHHDVGPLLVEDRAIRSTSSARRHVGQPAVGIAEPLVPVRRPAERRSRPGGPPPAGRRRGSPGWRRSPRRSPRPRRRWRAPGRTGSPDRPVQRDQRRRPRTRRRPGGRRPRPASRHAARRTGGQGSSRSTERCKNRVASRSVTGPRRGQVAVVPAVHALDVAQRGGEKDLVGGLGLLGRSRCARDRRTIPAAARG